MGKKVTQNEYLYQQIKKQIADGETDITSLDEDVLAGLMDYETNMLYMGKGDVAFISKCAALLDEKRTQLMSHEDYVAAIEKAKKQSGVITQPQKSSKRSALKRVAIVAATLALLVAACTLVASALGFDVFGAIKKVMFQPNGTEITEDGITVRNNGKMWDYKTIEDALKHLDRDIMYPNALPEGVKLKAVYIAETDYGDMNLIITTTNFNVSVSIYVGIDQQRSLGSDDVIYRCGDLSYQVFEYENEFGHTYRAFCIDGDCDYYLSAEKYEDLIFMIDNMKEN